MVSDIKLFYLSYTHEYQGQHNRTEESLMLCCCSSWFLDTVQCFFVSLTLYKMGSHITHVRDDVSWPIIQKIN